MRRILLVATFLGALVLVAALSPALAGYGAFAVDGETNKYGYSWDKNTPKDADAAALKGCATDKCKIVFRTGPKECGALAFTASGKKWGGARRSQSDAAELAAKQSCQKRSADDCKIRASRCNR